MKISETLCATPTQPPPLNCKIFWELAFVFVPGMKCWLRVCPISYFLKNRPILPANFRDFFGLRNSGNPKPKCNFWKFCPKAILKNDIRHPPSPPLGRDQNNSIPKKAYVPQRNTLEYRIGKISQEFLISETATLQSENDKYVESSESIVLIKNKIKGFYNGSSDFERLI